MQVNNDAGHSDGSSHSFDSDYDGDKLPEEEVNTNNQELTSRSRNASPLDDIRKREKPPKVKPSDERPSSLLLDKALPWLDPRFTSHHYGLNFPTAGLPSPLQAMAHAQLYSEFLRANHAPPAAAYEKVRSVSEAEHEAQDLRMGPRSSFSLPDGQTAKERSGEREVRSPSPTESDMAMEESTAEGSVGGLKQEERSPSIGRISPNQPAGTTPPAWSYEEQFKQVCQLWLNVLGGDVVSASV